MNIENINRKPYKVRAVIKPYNIGPIPLEKIEYHIMYEETTVFIALLKSRAQEVADYLNIGWRVGYIDALGESL